MNLKRKEKGIDIRYLLLLFIAAFICTACANPRLTARIALAKAAGKIEIVNRRGKDVSPRENLHLFDGYRMGTDVLSYAWMNLDEERLVKLDQDSQIGIQKEKKKLLCKRISGEERSVYEKKYQMELIQNGLKQLASCRNGILCLRN